MKNFYISCLLMASAWCFGACTNGDPVNPQPATDETEKTVTVRFAATNTLEEEDTTKATLLPDDTETYFTADWEANDGLGVYASYNGTKSNKNIRFTYDGSRFSGELATNAAATVWSYYAYYPYQTSNSEIPFGRNRTQKGSEFNGAYDLMTGSLPDVANEQPGVDADGRPLVIPMKRQTAILYFHFTTDEVWAETEKVTRIELAADKYIASQNYAKYSDSRYAYEIGSANRVNGITLTFEEGTAPTAADFKAYFNIFTASSSIKLSLTVYTEGHKLTLVKPAATYTAGMLYRVRKSVPAATWKEYNPGPLPAPELLDDADHVTVTPNAVTVRWDAVPNATGYACGYVHPATNETVSATTAAPVVTIGDLAPETVYTFTFRATALGDGVDYQNSPESSRTYTVTTSAADNIDPNEPVVYLWDFEVLYPETTSSFTGEFTLPSSPAGCNLTFNASGASVAYDAKWLNGSKCRLKMGGNSSIKNGMPTRRYFEFTAAKSGRLTIVHQSAGSGERHTLIRVGDTDPITVAAPSGYVETNTYESGLIAITEPTRIMIYFDNGINLNRISWTE